MEKWLKFAVHRVLFMASFVAVSIMTLMFLNKVRRSNRSMPMMREKKGRGKREESEKEKNKNNESRIRQPIITSSLGGGWKVIKRNDNFITVVNETASRTITPSFSFHFPVYVLFFSYLEKSKGGRKKKPFHMEKKKWALEGSFSEWKKKQWK